VATAGVGWWVMPELYAEPTTVDEALEALGQLGPDAGIVAGGTDLVVGARGGKKPLPEALVAIHRLAGLGAIAGGSGSPLALGALVTHADLETSSLVRERWSALADASALVGSPATRHVGTIGGNLCNASPAMEAGGPLLVFGASVEVAGPGGSRTVPVGEFLVGPGKTSLAAGELLTGVTVPEPAPGSGSAYVRLEYRQTMEIAVVGAAALVTLDGAAVAEVRIALAAVAPTCVRAHAAEDALRGREPTAGALDEASALAAGAATPIDDVRAPAGYRRAMVPVIVKRALERAVQRAKEAS
jgi:CO/xanthine dehydrogenase FAD-binding subunit